MSVCHIQAHTEWPGIAKPKITSQGGALSGLFRSRITLRRESRSGMLDGPVALRAQRDRESRNDAIRGRWKLICRDITVHEFHVPPTVCVYTPLRPFKHRLGQIHDDHATVRSDGYQERREIQACPAAELDYGVARVKVRRGNSLAAITIFTKSDKVLEAGGNIIALRAFSICLCNRLRCQNHRSIRACMRW